MDWTNRSDRLDGADRPNRLDGTDGLYWAWGNCNKYRCDGSDGPNGFGRINGFDRSDRVNGLDGPNRIYRPNRPNGFNWTIRCNR